MSLFRAALSTRVQGKRRSRLRRAARLRRSATTATATGLTGAVLAVDALVGAGSASAATLGEFQRLAQCESGGNFSINTGNGYYGAYQFSLPTWRSLGYGGYPHQASPQVQTEAAVKLQARSGWGQWPACSRKLGLRSPRGLTEPLPAPAPVTAIEAHYAASPGVRAGVGAPVSGEFGVPGGAARIHRSGHIVSSPATGAKAVWGEIYREYGELRWEQGRLGFPVSDELAIPGGRQSLFQHGVIVWSADTGAQVLWGDVRRKYEALGGVQGALGFPTSSERPEAGGVSQAFAGGEIFWDADSHATTALSGEVLEAYRAAGGPAGQLGMPVRKAAAAAGAEVLFEGGSIRLDAGTRTAAVVTG